MFFRGSKEECTSLVEWLNSLMPGVVKFKFEFSFEEIEFLDLKIFLEGGRIITELYVKPTNKQLYLDYNSNHPHHCKKGIPYSQALRIVERCAKTEDRDKHLDVLRKKLEERNYPKELIEEQFRRAKMKDRKSLIYQKRNPNTKKDQKVRLIFTQNQANPPLHKWIRECKPLLKSEKPKAIGDNIQIGYKQPKNLQRLVGGSMGGPGGGPKTPPPDAGCKKCKKCKVACPILEETKTFKSTNTGKVYNIKESVTCTSDWVIYLSTCKKCAGQYVGKSKTPFKLRHSNHKIEIRDKRGGLGSHFGGRGGCGYEHISIVIIEQVKNKNLKYLAAREVFWQHQLRVFVENGGRAHCIRKDL